jgi:hypothetical protein
MMAIMTISHVCSREEDDGYNDDLIFVYSGEEDDGYEERCALHRVGQARQRAERSHPQDHQGEDTPGFAQVATLFMLRFSRPVFEKKSMPLNRCCGSVTFLFGSGSTDLYP